MKTKIRRRQILGQDKRVSFYPDTVKGWRKYLVILFSLIGFMTVFVWSMSAFYQAIIFWIIEPKSIVVFNKSEKKSVIGETAQADSNDALIERPDENEEEDQGTPSSSASQIEKEVLDVFGGDAKVALAIFKSESGLKPDNKNWNCYYYRTDGTRYSDICKPEDRGKAWSMDCGVAQINTLTPGSVKECPKELFDYKNNIRVAKGMFNQRGFQPWVNFNNGYYLANL